MSLIHSHTTLW